MCAEPAIFTRVVNAETRFAVNGAAPAVVAWAGFEPTWKFILKKLIVLASFLSAFAVSGFAQTAPARTPAEAGAQLVAQRDAAYAKAHPGSAKAQSPKAQTPKAHTSTKHDKSAKNSQHAKKSQHHNHNSKKKSHHNKPKTE